jgi:hypothetical protein
MCLLFNFKQEAKRASKMEARVEVATRGYAARAAKLEASLQTEWARQVQLQHELAAFQALAAAEDRAIIKRLARATAEAAAAEELERVQQTRYAALRAQLQEQSV